MSNSASSTLRARWRDGSDGRLAVVKKHFVAALDVVDQIAKERATLAADKFLNDLGKSQKLAEFARAKAAQVAKAVRSVDIGRAKMAEARAALIPSVSDKTDVAGALLRREERDRLNKLSPADIVAIVADKNTPDITLTAVFEAPHLVPAIPPEAKERLIDDLLARRSGPAVAVLRDQTEALDLLQTATRISAEALREAAGVSPHGFEKWLAEVAPADQKKLDAEKAEFQAESVAAGAKALPLAARMSLVESLLATNTAEIANAS